MLLRKPFILHCFELRINFIERSSYVLIKNILIEKLFTLVHFTTCVALLWILRSWTYIGFVSFLLNHSDCWERSNTRVLYWDKGLLSFSSRKWQLLILLLSVALLGSSGAFTFLLLLRGVFLCHLVSYGSFLIKTGRHKCHRLLRRRLRLRDFSCLALL